MSANCFIKHEGKIYGPLTILSVRQDPQITNAEVLITNIGVDSSWPCKLNPNTDDFKAMLDTMAKPAVGSKIYITPNCPIPAADIRKNYTIKRAIDEGDYNVFTPIRVDSDMGYYCLLPDKNSVVFISYYGNQGTRQEFVRVLRGISGYENIRESELDYIGYGRIAHDVVPEAYHRLYEGKLVKPCISYTQLDTNYGLELTDDAVELVYRTGCAQWSYENEQKCCLEISALAQYNWRDYPRTMYVLTTLLQARHRGVYSYIRHAPSRQTKSVRQVVTTEFPPKTSSEKDFEMAKRLMLKVLNLEDGTKFVPFDSVASRLRELQVPIPLFHEVFDTIVRIQPKKYETTDNTI